MARTKGALNRRTRAALSAAAEGKLAEGGEKTISYLLKIANDPKRDDAVRMQAASVALPYVKPKLASIEQTNIDERDKQSEAELMSQLQGLIAASPDLAEKFILTVLAVDPGIVDRAVAAYRQQESPQPSGNVIPLQEAKAH